MFTFNGFGTTIYGQRDRNPEDNSYIVTKWFVILFFPIFPVGSYRAIKEKQGFFHAGFPKYQMTPVALNTKQVVFTYLAWWSIPIVLLIFALFY